MAVWTIQNRYSKATCTCDEEGWAAIVRKGWGERFTRVNDEANPDSVSKRPVTSFSPQELVKVKTAKEKKDKTEVKN